MFLRISRDDLSIRNVRNILYRTDKKYCPFLYSEQHYKIGQDLLDIRYVNSFYPFIPVLKDTQSEFLFVEILNKIWTEI